MLDRQELFDVVFQFRFRIESCWSDDTAYKVPGVVMYGPGIPVGQCAVTCLVLMDVLEEKFPKLQMRLVGGSVHSSGQRVLIPSHVWLEVTEGESTYLIDPTIDQCPEIKDPVIVASMQDLHEQGLFYTTAETENDRGALRHPNRFVRYQKLKSRYAS